MPPSPPPDPAPQERSEWRDVLVTFVPAVLVAFALERALTTFWGWPSQRALWTGLAVGIVLALGLQRLLARRGRP
jgi:hypothetical protein